MPDENNLQTPSVEAALAAPQNQPTQNVADNVFGLQSQTTMPQPQASTTADSVFGGGTPVMPTLPAVRPAQTSATTPQKSSVQELLATARNLVQRHIGDIEAVNPQMASTIGRLYASPPTAPQPTQPTAPATSSMPKITMVAPTGGGTPLAGYDYKGSRVLLGDGVDVNDAEAVQRRITENNELIDMIDSAYEEEV